MQPRRIDDVLRYQLCTFRDCGIPEPVSGKRWLRFACPFCGGDKAAISYEFGYFECFHKRCGKRVSATGDNSAVRRFWPQINQAARNIAVKFPYLLRGSEMFREARNHAAMRVMIYAGKPLAGDCDAGQLGEWQEQVKDDPDQLDRFVLRALNMDLLDYAKSKLRQNRRETKLETLEISVGFQVIGYVSDGSLDSYPTLRMRYGDGLTREEMARELKVPLARVKRLISAETKRYQADHLAA